MNILITGANGFVGRYVRNFFGKNFNVVGIVRSDDKSDNRNYILNLADANAVEDFIKCDESKVQFDVIIHLASVMAARNNLEDLNILGINAEITKNTIVLAEHFKVKHVINFSSTSVYPNIDGVYNEGSVTDPSKNTDCIYGLSKLNSEVLLNYFNPENNIIITHLRCGMIFSDAMDSTRIFPVLKRELVNKNQATLYGNGKRVINYIMIEELMGYIERFIILKSGGIYNVIEHSETTLQLANKIAIEEDIKDAKIILIEKGNSFKFVVDNSKSKNLYKADA